MNAAHPSPERGPEPGGPTVPRREDLVSIDRAARLLGVTVHTAWRRLENGGVRVHSVEWDGRRVQAVLRSDVLELRDRSEPSPAADEPPPGRALRVRPVRGGREASTERAAEADPAEPLVGELRDVLRERDLLRLRAENLASELEELRSRPSHDMLEIELADRRARLEEAQRGLAVSRRELAERTAELDEARRLARALEDERDRARAEAAHAAALNARLQAAEIQLEAARQELELSEHELAVARERARLADDLRAELAEMAADRARLVRDLRAARAEAAELAKTVQRLDADARSNARYLDKLEARLRVARDRRRGGSA